MFCNDIRKVSYLFQRSIKINFKTKNDYLVITKTANIFFLNFSWIFNFSILNLTKYRNFKYLKSLYYLSIMTKRKILR